MSYYLKDGEDLWPTEENAFNIQKTLPVGTYTIGSHPIKGWFLKPVTNFEINGKIYGKTTRHADRILSTFLNRPYTTGVLLNGEKGSGKTMLAKLISQMARKDGISTLVINSPYCGDSFNTLIQSIDEPCIIIYDEFEKVFDDEQQEATLTLLDGVYPTKKLFILTVNDKYRVSQHMRNRPGRIFYNVEYKGLDSEFIREYCEDCLDDKQYIDQVVRLTLMFDSFNFDMLKALVEEMNRYKETPNQAMEILNAKPYDAGHIKHHVTILHSGLEIETGCIYPSTIRGNPLAQDNLEISFTSKTLKPSKSKTKTLDDEDVETEYDNTNVCLEISPQHLKRIDAAAGTFTYVLEEGKPNMSVVVFTRENYIKNPLNWIDAY